MNTKIIVEGWRFLPHSFATVNQFQCLELLKRPHLKVFHRDVPYWNSKWKPVNGLLSEGAESALRNIPAPPAGENGDVTLRMGCPFDFSRSNSARTVTFATCEFGRLSGDVIAMPGTTGSDVNGASIVTPSHWSREGLVRSGMDPEDITIVPHGIDPDIFHPPSGAERVALRKKFGWEGYFIFLHVSAMTPNKGIPAILRSLHEVARKRANVRLVLKGLDSLYASTAALGECLKSLPGDIHPAIQSRVAYTSGDRSYREIADLYRAADAYIAPYLGEGFNLPVLEAAACGLPVICTSGGPTDDFTTDDFRLSIESRRLVKGDPDNPGLVCLAPDQSHISSRMNEIMDNDPWRENARSAGPEYVHSRFTWKQVVDSLEDVLFDR